MSEDYKFSYDCKVFSVVTLQMIMITSVIDKWKSQPQK